MTTDLRALVQEWRERADEYAADLALGITSDEVAAIRECADELQAALDAQAGLVCVGWEELLSFGYRGAEWVRIGHVGPDWTPPTGRPADKYRRIYAGPVEGGK